MQATEYRSHYNARVLRNAVPLNLDFRLLDAWSGSPGPRLDGSVNGSYWANLLSQKLGYAVSAGEKYYTPNCTRPRNVCFLMVSFLNVHGRRRPSASKITVYRIQRGVRRLVWHPYI